MGKVSFYLLRMGTGFVAAMAATAPDDEGFEVRTAGIGFFHRESTRDLMSLYTAVIGFCGLSSCDAFLRIGLSSVDEELLVLFNGMR